MPNEKVRYLKNNNIIKDKIVYVNDKDLIGCDSSNTNAFLFRYWKMKNFGITDNFIVMDDDYFIGKKLKKNTFFNVENGKVVPSITTSRFLKVEKDSTLKKYNLYKFKVDHSKEEQNDDVFNYSLQLTYLLIMNEFKKDLIYIPKFTHNAIPVNINELREIYDLVYKSEYKLQTLYSLYRENGYVQFQECYISYIFIKYKRKVKDISNKFIIINKSISSDYNFSLFCINKGPYNYSYLIDYKAKIAMEKLFPKATPYEIIDNSLINISFNVVKTMERTINKYEEQIKQLLKIQTRNWFKFFLLILFFLIFFKIYPNNELFFK